MRLLPTLLAAFFAFAAAALLAAGPSAAEDAATDLMTITPEELLRPAGGDAVARANTAYQEGRYEDAARAFVEALRANPADANAIYNLACCYGLLGAEGQASRFLEAAFRAGFDDLDHVRRDPDFEKVRESEPFRAAVGRIEAALAERARAGGVRRTIRGEFLAEYRVVAPDEGSVEGRLPVVVALHGYGDDAGNFAALFRRRSLPQPFLFVTVETPYAFPAGPRGLGYSWTKEGISPGVAEESAKLCAELVIRVIEDVKRNHRIDERKVYLLGFSQGAGLAFRVGIAHPELFAGVIPVGGWFDAGAHTPEELRHAARHGAGPFLVCHSPGDRVVPFASATEAAAELAKLELGYELVEYEGGHSLPAALLTRITDWMDLPSPARPDR